MSPASQSLLKFATLQFTGFLTDFHDFALSPSEPQVNVTISATLSEPPPTPVLWCLLTWDAFRDLSQLPFLHQSLLEYEKDVLDIMPCCTPSPSFYCKKKSLYQHPLWLESLQLSPVGMSEGLPSGHRD